MRPFAEQRDDVSLAAGLGVIALGLLLLADQVDAIELSFGWLAAATAAVAGMALLISGLRDPVRTADPRPTVEGDP